MKRLVLPSIALSLACGLAAQSNTVPGLDGKLEILDNITYWGRRGAAYPNGEIGLSMRNTMCNPGSVSIPWYAAMQENHPKFGFLITRLSGDRMEQISDRSYCKHAFTSASTNGACGPCNGIGGNLMGVTCSDTYGAGNNADRYWLGPPSEIDPWLGTWTVIGSYFDRGDPDVGAPGNMDGNRSLTGTQTGAFDAVKNRVTVRESDLTVAGAQYFYAIQLIHEGEAVANRWDNIKSRGFTPNYSGGSWSVTNSGPGQTFGSVLQHWPGATVNSGGNGNDDGRFFVASKVTVLGGGQYHYEYAVHNVDNSRAGATLRIPIEASAVASNYSFRDIDQNPLNNWTAARVGNQIVFTAPASNPLEWNTIYNFGFDANFPPGSGLVTLDEARIGAGSLTVDVAADVPSGSTFAQWSAFGAGCGGTNCQSSFYELFASAAQFDLSNSSWTMTYGSGQYQLGTGTGTYQTPAGSTLALTDDSSIAVALPFSLAYPGGTTTQLHVCSNGFVSPAANGTSFTPTSSELLGGGPRWAALWHDLNPGAGGTVRADVNASRAIISFSGVANYGTTGTSTFQLQFLPNGTVHVIYQACTPDGNSTLVGWSPGGGVGDPGGVDISATLAGGLALCNGPTPDVTLASSARPILGTTIQLITGNIPVGTLGGVSILSTTELIPGVNLGALGAPLCTVYLALDVLTVFPTPGSSASVPFVLPNNPSVSGGLVVSQSATLKPGINAFGWATSNGVRLLLGVN